MKAGETERATCNECDTEFEVTFEPKAVNMAEEDRPKDEDDLRHCPFCSSDSIEIDLAQ